MPNPIEHLSDFLQGKLLCLGIEVNDQEVTNQNTAPNDIVLPLDSPQSNRIDVTAEQIRTRITKLFDDERFRSKIVRTDFSNVAVHDGSWHFVENPEDEDHGNGGSAHGSVRKVVALIDSSQDREDQKSAEHSCHTSQEERTSTNSVSTQLFNDEDLAGTVNEFKITTIVVSITTFAIAISLVLLAAQLPRIKRSAIYRKWHGKMQHRRVSEKKKSRAVVRVSRVIN
jgi:hypothetical protein